VTDAPEKPNTSRAHSETVRLVLPYPISANRYWRPVQIRDKRTGKYRSQNVTTKEAKAYIDECGWRARTAGLHKPTPERIAVHLALHPARPQDWERRARKDPERWDDTVRCMDLGNCEKVAMDALNGIAWVDDKQIWDMHLVRGEPVENGSLVVTIRVIERADLLGHDLMELRR